MGDPSDNPSESSLLGNDRPEIRQASASTDTARDSIVLDELLGLLAARRRQLVLYCLETSETPMAVADLADDLIRLTTDASPPTVQDERERVYLSLYHRHLPKLADAGLVSFDSDRNLVGLCGDAEDLPSSTDESSTNNHPGKSN